MHDLMPAPATTTRSPVTSAPARPRPWWRQVPLPCAVVLGVSAATFAVSAVLGLVAAAVGGPLSALGAGPGGLWGVPQLLLLAVAGLVGAPVGIAAVLGGIRRGAWRRVAYGSAMLLGPLLLAFGSFAVPHAVDPCGGTFDLRTRVASVPVCMRYDSTAGGISVDDRFHLLLHGAVAGPMAVPVLLHIRAAGRRMVSARG